MAEHVPHIDEGPLTCTVGATAVVGGQLVAISAGMTVIPAAAGSVKVVGVAGRDGAIGAQVPVYLEGVHDLTASGAITAGDQVVAGAAGTVATVAAIGAYSGNERAILGLALESIADTAKGRILLKNG